MTHPSPKRIRVRAKTARAPREANAVRKPSQPSGEMRNHHHEPDCPNTCQRCHEAPPQRIVAGLTHLNESSRISMNRPTLRTERAVVHKLNLTVLIDNKLRRSSDGLQGHGGLASDPNPTRSGGSAAHARSPTANSLHATLDRRTLLRLDPMAAPCSRPLGVPPTELPRLCSTRLSRCPA